MAEHGASKKNGQSSAQAPEDVVVAVSNTDANRVHIESSGKPPTSNAAPKPALAAALPNMSQADIEAMFEKLLHPPPMDEGFGGEERTQCHIRESVMQSIEYALHCAICIAVLSGIVLYTPADALRIVASTPFLLPIAGIMATGPTLGIGILKSVVILWALVIGVVVVSVATLPFHCSPIAQAVAFFFLMWLSRYWLSYFGAPSNMKFVSAIHLLGALSSIQLSSAAGTCDYSTWPLLLVALISFAISTTVAFLSSFLPWPRFSFMDAAHLNRRVMRDSVRLVKASLSVLLLAHQRPEDDDGDCSDSNCQHAKVRRCRCTDTVCIDQFCLSLLELFWLGTFFCELGPLTQCITVRKGRQS